MMKRFQDLINDAQQTVGEVLPWDLEELLQADTPPMLLDVREPYEFEEAHIPGSLNVPRGILETACEWGYEETVPELVEARERDIIVICRSGNRSLLAAQVMQWMGYQSVKSLKTGVRGWNDYDQTLQDSEHRVVDGDDAEDMLAPIIRPEQMPPDRR